MITYKDYIKQNEGIGIEMFIHNTLKKYGKVITHEENGHYTVDFHSLKCSNKDEILSELGKYFQVTVLDKCSFDLKLK